MGLLTGGLILLGLGVGFGLNDLSQLANAPLEKKMTSNQIYQSNPLFVNITQSGAGLKELEPNQRLPSLPPSQLHLKENPLISIENTTFSYLSNQTVQPVVSQLTGPSTKTKIEQHALSSTSHSPSQPRVTFHEIYKVPRGYCALTFDDGPSAYTEKIARLLKKEHIPATFFFIGVNVSQRPKAVSFANSQGFKIGDHSYSHPQLTKLSKTAQESQILKTKKQLEAIIKKPVIYFRPPYGAFNSQTKSILIKYHMEMVLWNNDPRDWATKSPSVIVQRLSHSVLNGKVIILHDQRQTWEALPQIIKVIKSKGLRVKAI